MDSVTVDPLTLAYHELRGPLGLIVTAARSAAEECPDNSLRERCQTIARAAERMLATAHQILSMPEQRGDHEARYDPLGSVASVVAEMCSLGLPVSLGGSLESASASGNQDRFEALVSSLLHNASDHAEPGTTVSVDTSTSGEDMFIEIRNRRAGSDGHKGLGLGQYICRELAKDLGAELRSEVRDAHYHTSIRLPLVGRKVAVAI